MANQKYATDELVRIIDARLIELAEEIERESRYEPESSSALTSKEDQFNLADPSDCQGTIAASPSLHAVPGGWDRRLAAVIKSFCSRR